MLKESCLSQVHFMWQLAIFGQCHPVKFIFFWGASLHIIEQFDYYQM